jgi:uncharacterized membrane protein YfcA
MTVPFMLYCNVRSAGGGNGGAVGLIASAARSGTSTPVGTLRATRVELGYVYLPALAGITIASVLTAPLGARLAHRMPGRLLKRIFAGLMFVLAARMLFSLW